MSRDCFFCRKPLEVRHRATVFCSPRCQSLYSQMYQGSGLHEEPPRYGPPASSSKQARPKAPVSSR